MLIYSLRSKIPAVQLVKKPFSIHDSIIKRFQSTMDDYESKIYNTLTKEFEPKNLEVRDVSGGCGSMFSIDIESPRFKGLPMIKQHRLVNQVLKDEISKWHGLQLKTKAPKD